MISDGQRTDYERLAAAAIAPILQAMRREIMAAVRNGATAEQAAAIAARYQTRLADAIESVLITVVMASADAFAGTISYGLPDDFATVAGAWARQHAIDITGKMTEVTARIIRQHVGDYFDRGLTLAELERRLQASGMFGAQRANVIATTEVTRAAAQGEKEIADTIYRNNHLRLIPYWLTNRDEYVCPICRPLDGLEIRPDNETHGMFPPAHPRCRCSVRWRLPRRASS